MIYVYCPRPSDSANALVAAINAAGGTARRKRLINFRLPGAAIINWGGHDVLPAGRKILNATTMHNKFNELHKLMAAGVPVPRHNRTGAGPSEKLARRFGHQEGNDLLRGLTRGDYYVEKLDIEREFRLHVVNGVVVRTGKKMPHDNAHPWIRSTAAGWYLDYGSGWRGEMQQSYREAAKAAVKALGYDFGAVDLAVLRSAQRPRPFVVLEVNSAPGLTIANTAAAYAKHFIEMLR